MLPLPFPQSALKSRGYLWLVLLSVVLTSGCSTVAERHDAFAARHGFTQDWINGTDFSHRVYIRESAASKQKAWHVYIEGDGKAWAQRHVVATDPTPRDPLMLQLMTQDVRPSIYLGRPCYHGTHSAPACNPWLWTYGRYSPQVVASLRAALRVLIDRYAIRSVVLIGHSGGGTLAMLLAETLPETCVVVTLAGNLDIDAWATKHRYTPLLDSLNPAQRPPLPAQIMQLHYAGKDDVNIPPEMLAAAIKAQDNPQFFVLDNVSHRHGWNEHFLTILQTIDSLGGDGE